MLTHPAFIRFAIAAVFVVQGCGNKDDGSTDGGPDSGVGGDDDTASTTAPEGTSPGDCSDGVDNDGDGLTDCDDEGCDGSADCADPVVDVDGDGVPAEEDCDDNDPSMPNDDADCDGAATADDCDDSDATIRPQAGDTYGDGIDSDCDNLDCEAASHGTKYLAACPGNITWVDADTACRDGGHDSLASIVDASENAFVYALINATTSSYTAYWIGLNDVATEGTYVWSDGSPTSYFNWHANEPDGSASKNCVALLSAGGANSEGWSDSECTNMLSGFTCSASLPDRTEPVADEDGDGIPADEDCNDNDASMPLDDADCDGTRTADDCNDNNADIYPYAGDAYGDGVDSDCDAMDCAAASDGVNYFAACPDSISWADAESTCRAGGYDSLASITDEVENTFLFELVNASTTAYTGYWIGLNDAASEGDYVWSDGLPATYFNWHANEPDGVASRNCVALISAGGANSAGWSDAECSILLNGFTCSLRF